MEIKEGLGFSTFTEMLTVLPNDMACRVYLENRIWQNGVPTCPHCKSQDHYVLTTKGEFRGLYKCKSCQHRYTVTIGTMFEGSHIGLRKWFIAIFILSTHKKGISSHQLASDLGITQKSSWFMLNRIRNAFKPDNPKQFDDVVEVDETFVGGKNKNRHWDKKVKNSQGRSFKDKTPVFGMVSKGKVECHVIPDTKVSSIRPIILNRIAPGSTIYSDEWSAYEGLGHLYNHEIVDHGRGQYKNGDACTNTIEGFWSIFKRGIIGIYHFVSRKHLQCYVDEFAYRYNSRKESISNKFNFPLLNSKRLTYAMLVGKVV